MSALMDHALEIAISEKGKGEKGGNNRGPDVDRYRAGARVGGIGGSGAWCAAFVSYCLRWAAAELRISLPFETSAGAKRLIKNVRDSAGAEVMNVNAWCNTLHPLPGALVCWHRGILSPLGWGWQGHIGFLKRWEADGDRLVTIEGNRGPLVGEYAYPNGLWRKRLFMVVTF